MVCLLLCALLYLFPFPLSLPIMYLNKRIPTLSLDMSSPRKTCLMCYSAYLLQIYLTIKYNWHLYGCPVNISIANTNIPCLFQALFLRKHISIKKDLLVTRTVWHLTFDDGKRLTLSSYFLRIPSFYSIYEKWMNYK